LVRQMAEEYALHVLGYCLMTNHVHLVALPKKPDSLSKAIGPADYMYTQYVNRLHGRSGHLWQNRFHSCALDEDHFWRAMRYVEQNPVRAGIVKEATEYEWSSAAAHVTGEDPMEILAMDHWSAEMDGATWRRLLSCAAAKADVKAIRKCTERGWPLSTDGFLSKMEKRMGRRLRPLASGRPKGAKDGPRRRTRRQ
jgi:putative transposase